MKDSGEQASGGEIKIENNRDYSITELQLLRRSNPLHRRNTGEDNSKSTEKESHDHEEKTLKNKKINLKDLITKNKTQVLSKNFLNKLTLNLTGRQPVEELQNYENHEQTKLLNKFVTNCRDYSGLKIGNTTMTVWTIINMLHSILMVFVFSIMMGFPQTVKDEIFFYIRIGSMGVYVMDIFLNLVVERYQKGKLLENIGQISLFYLKSYFIFDIISILILILDLIVGAKITLLTTIVSFIRFTSSWKKCEKLEYLYISSTEREQYYGLVKVLLTNFAIAHVLSILLNLTATLSQNNWWAKIQIYEEQWYIKYIWGYYWGTNIMLTVGFGDLSATNPYQAGILIFIQTFSCITLAYNISYVGMLIGLISSKQEEKKKKLKFFHKMCKQNEIPQDLESKIKNYIEQSYEMKDIFSFDEYDSVIKCLPKDMQLQYRKEANKVVFDGLGFLTNLSKKTMIRMAELVEKKMCHPNQYIKKKGEKIEFMILQRGKLCLTCKAHRYRSSLDGKVIETLSVGQGEKPKIISLDFIKNKSVNYDIKSEGYSVLYTLSLDSFKESLQFSEMDLQLYCILKDRDGCVLDEENIYPCSLCKNKYHTKFECSRLHYRPIKQMHIFRHLDSFKRQKNTRKKIIRPQKNLLPIKSMKLVCGNYAKFTMNAITLNEEKMETEKRKHNNTQNTQKNQPPRERESSLPLNKQNGSSKMIDKLDRLEQIINDNLTERKFWDLQCDQAYNFKYYFKNFNPNSISQRKKKIGPF